MRFEEKLKFDNGEGYLAADPGKPGRYLWSVTFPEALARIDGKTGEVLTPYYPKSFRYGSADSKDEALKALNAAYREGRPTGDRETGQYVTPAKKPSIMKAPKGRAYVADRSGK